MMAESSSFRRNSAEVFLTRIVVVLILLGTNVLVTRALGTSDRGVWALAVTLPLLLQQVAGLGINQSNIYFVSRGERVRSVVVNSLIMAFVITGVLLVIAWPLHDVILATVLNGMPAGVFMLLVALMPFSFMDLFYTSVIQGLGRFRLFNTRRLWVSLMMLGSLAIALLVFDAGLRGAVAALALTIVATGLLFLFIMVRIDGIDLRLRPALLRRTLQYGIKSYAATLASYLSYRIDLLLLAFLRGPTSVAYYAVAVSLIESLWYIPDSIGVVLFPKLSALKDDKAIHAFTAKVCRMTVSVTATAALVLALVGYGAIILLFGHRYEPSVVPMLVLLPGAVSIAVYKILWRNFSGRNRQQVTVVAACVALTVNVALNLALIPRFGPTGAALASTCSYTLGAAILLVVFVRHSGIGVRSTLVADRSDLAEEYAWIRKRLSRTSSRDARDA